MVPADLRYTTDHDLNGSFLCLLAVQVSIMLDRGMWQEAEDKARDLLYVRETSRASRVDPLVTLGLLNARRGDRASAWSLLDEAREHVKDAQVLDYDGLIAAARGEGGNWGHHQCTRGCRSIASRKGR